MFQFKKKKIKLTLVVNDDNIPIAVEVNDRSYKNLQKVAKKNNTTAEEIMKELIKNHFSDEIMNKWGIST